MRESDDYLLYQDDFSRDWIIALNSQSLCNNSIYAVHGGATPEEVVVLPCGSKSITKTFFLAATIEAAKLTQVVVFPTPPF